MPSSKKDGSGNPRFFCESCGTEVPRNAKNCPSCGRYFASVLCPSCGFAGEEDLFKGGCPVCGYSSKASASKNAGDSELFPLEFPESKKASGPLPFWVYILTAGIFTAVAAALLFKVFK